MILNHKIRVGYMPYSYPHMGAQWAKLGGVIIFDLVLKEKALLYPKFPSKKTGILKITTKVFWLLFKQLVLKLESEK